MRVCIGLLSLFKPILALALEAQYPEQYQIVLYRNRQANEIESGLVFFLLSLGFSKK